MNAQELKTIETLISQGVQPQGTSLGHTIIEARENILNSGDCRYCATRIPEGLSATIVEAKTDADRYKVRVHYANNISALYTGRLD